MTYTDKFATSTCYDILINWKKLHQRAVKQTYAQSISISPASMGSVVNLELCDGHCRIRMVHTEIRIESCEVGDVS